MPITIIIKLSVLLIEPKCFPREGLGYYASAYFKQKENDKLDTISLTKKNFRYSFLTLALEINHASN